MGARKYPGSSPQGRGHESLTLYLVMQEPPPLTRLTLLHCDTPNPSLRHLKHHRATMLLPHGRDKGRQLRIGQAMLLQHRQ